MAVGVCVVGTFGVTMVLSQLYLPRHVGMASGLSVGLAMGVGGIAAVALGAVADAVDLRTALTISAVAPALGVFLCLRLPRPASLPRRVVEPYRRGLTSCSSGSAISISSAATSTRRSRSTPRCSARSVSSRRSSFRESAASRSTISASRRPAAGSLGLRQALAEQPFELDGPGLHHFALRGRVAGPTSTPPAGGRRTRRDPAPAEALAAVPPRVLRNVLPRPGRVPARGRGFARRSALAEVPRVDHVLAERREAELAVHRAHRRVLLRVRGRDAGDAARRGGSRRPRVFTTVASPRPR